MKAKTVTSKVAKKKSAAVAERNVAVLVRSGVAKKTIVVKKDTILDFFKSKKKLVQAVYLSAKSVSEDFYLVILKTPTSKDRNEFRGFAEEYSKTHKRSLKFRFIDPSFAEDKLDFIKKIDL